MKQRISRKLALVLTIVMVVCLGVVTGTAYAYYTDTSKANGMIRFAWEPDEPHTEVSEELHGLNKSIVINNTGDENAADALVRVKLVYPDPLKMEGNVKITISKTVADWKEADGWLYYTKPLAPGQSTSEIKVDVEVKEEDKLRPFDIVVVQQCAKAEGTSSDDWHGTFAASEGAVYLKDPANPVKPENQGKQPVNPITAESE